MTGNGRNDALSCEDAERAIVRHLEGGTAPREQELLDRHLVTCAACQAALEEQRLVLDTLRRRPPVVPDGGFARRLSERLDREADAGMLGLLNWRAWTVGLAPVAAALTLAAYVGVGSTQVATDADTSPVQTFEAWTTAGPAEGTAAAVLLEPSATGDALLESVLVGGVPAAGGRDVR